MGTFGASLTALAKRSSLVLVVLTEEMRSVSYVIYTLLVMPLSVAMLFSFILTNPVWADSIHSDITDMRHKLK